MNPIQLNNKKSPALFLEEDNSETQLNDEFVTFARGSAITGPSRQYSMGSTNSSDEESGVLLGQLTPQTAPQTPQTAPQTPCGPIAPTFATRFRDSETAPDATLHYTQRNEFLLNTFAAHRNQNTPLLSPLREESLDTCLLHGSPSFTHREDLQNVLDHDIQAISPNTNEIATSPHFSAPSAANAPCNPRILAPATPDSEEAPNVVVP